MKKSTFILLLILFSGCSRYEMRSDLLTIFLKADFVEQRDFQPLYPRFEIWQYRTQEKMGAEVEVCVSPLGFNAPSGRSLERWMYDPCFADREISPYKRASNWDITQTRIYEIRFTISR